MELKNQSRNIGIDLLRIISMLMVVILHIVGLGILSNPVIAQENYLVTWWIKAMVFCAVNCYALISGYVGIYSDFRYYKIVILWLQVIFYNVVILMVFVIFFEKKLSLGTLFCFFIPTMQSTYWYFTAYVGMFFFIPVLNIALQQLDKKKLQRLLITILVFFSFIPTILGVDPFILNVGYSTLWLAICYLFGGYIKRYSIEKIVQRKMVLALFFGMVVVTWLSKVVIKSENFVNYTSPTILLAGICLLLFFAGIEVKKQSARKIISVFATTSFSVYILHIHTWVWGELVNRFKDFGTLPTRIMLFKILKWAVIIYFVCSLIDAIRIKIFRVIKIKEYCQYIEKRFLN